MADVNDIDFVGIGFRRCATSWISTMLSMHPEICKPNSGLHYFNENYKKGKSWYLKNIALTKETSHKIYGEFSTTYSYPQYFEKVAHRLKREYPKTLILLSIRNPVDRTISDYRRSVYRGELNGKDVSIAECPDIIERGFYSPVIKTFQESFGNDNVLVVSFDSVVNDAKSTLSNIYSFLGVNKHYNPLDKNRREQSSTHLLLKKRNLLRNFQSYKNKLLRDPYYHILKKLYIKSLKYLKFFNPQVYPKNLELNQKTVNFYREDIIKTELLTGLDLSSWKENIRI